MDGSSCCSSCIKFCNEREEVETCFSYIQMTAQTERSELICKRESAFVLSYILCDGVKGRFFFGVFLV